MFFFTWPHYDAAADTCRFRLSPNWISLARIPLYAPAIWCFWHGHWWIGTGVFVGSIGLDGIDGPWARFLQWWFSSPTTVRKNRNGQPALHHNEIDEASLSWRQIMNYPGQTAFGAWLDPLADKLTNVISLWLVGCSAVGYTLVPWWLLLILTLLEFNLQFGVRYMKWYHSIDKPDANSYGKIKTWAEAVLVGIMALYQMDYLAGSSPLIAAMVLCIVLATASTYKHLEPWLRAKNLVPHPAST